ncbi:MAG TPA: TRAP transporter small permease subunit, partial [Alphaproteobacteria bacterium]|nr:TRAP transporter small permease subunit [Alphaproteobacteria bacterium]
MEIALDRTYRVYRFLLDDVIGYGSALVMFASVILAIAEIIRRYILGVVFDWGQDAVTYFTVAAIFLYFAVTQARRSHLAVTAVLDALRVKGYTKTVLVLRLIVTAGSL